MLGILPGVALGVALALIVLVRRVSQPHTAVLGRLPGTDRYRDIAVRADAAEVPGMLIFRFDAPLIFCNAAYFADEIRRLGAAATDPVVEVLIAAQQINQIDSTGANRLQRLHDELAANGVALSIAEAKNGLRAMIRRTGLEQQIGADQFYESIEDGVEAFYHRQEPKVG